MGRPFPNLVNQRFGRLLVIDQTVTPQFSQRSYVCKCDCGNTTIALPPLLKHGKKKSCGCLAIEILIKRSTSHGESNKTPEYRAWCAIKNRCTNKNEPSWMRYGGRGITICKRWEKIFENFLADMGRRPSTKHSIDRFPDNDGNYEPGNCRWATKAEQAQNRCSNLLVIYEGQQISLAKACALTGINYDAAKYRVSVGKPFDLSIHPNKRHIA